ncbi:hypothetical protein [Pedobacter ureilyticus]|uniref:Uncharacterized protein n=1 Tax=Pedobacter ureilyticus TaxID=1393051 RepID=A0ABW9J620_9SPHI|nr:hypothetical protein [Pedobacter helvus]
MKRLTLILLFVILKTSAFACDCDFNTTILYQKASFVAKIRIVKNHKNEVDTIPSYKVDIKPLVIYKGETTNSIYVPGYYKIPNKPFTSCDFYFNETSEYLIFGFKEGSNIYVDYCTILSQDFAADHYPKLIFLKTVIGNYTSNSPFTTNSRTSIPYNIFKEYPNEFYGKTYFVKITINKEKEVDNIELLSKFDKDLQERIIGDIKKINWKKRFSEINTTYSYSFISEFMAFNIP